MLTSKECDSTTLYVRKNDENQCLKLRNIYLERASYTQRVLDREWKPMWLRAIAYLYRLVSMYLFPISGIDLHHLTQRLRHLKFLGVCLAWRRAYINLKVINGSKKIVWSNLEPFRLQAAHANCHLKIKPTYKLWKNARCFVFGKKQYQYAFRTGHFLLQYLKLSYYRYHIDQGRISE